MEWWLISNDEKEKLQLPVPPSGYEIEKSNNNESVNIDDLGEVNLLGKSNLANIPIETFFPAKEYPFCQYTGFPAPYDCVSMIEKWRTLEKPIRLIITDTDINMYCSIENFKHSEQDGTGDVYFTLELKEYRYINVKTTSAVTDSKGYIKPCTSRATKTVRNTYTVKAGDTLYIIAKKLTGNGANYKTIASKNGIKNPSKLYVGEKLVI